jgi:hypothetical protein
MSFLSQFRNGRIVYTGAYSAATTYKFNNVVTYNFITYICKVASSVGVLPTNTTNWGILSETKVNAVTTGTGTNPTSYTLTGSGSTITYNKVS